jgi:hypothetical protein
MQYLYHVLSLREPVFIRLAELSGIQQVFFIKSHLLSFSSASNITKAKSCQVESSINLGMGLNFFDEILDGLF